LFALFISAVRQQRWLQVDERAPSFVLRRYRSAGAPPAVVAGQAGKCIQQEVQSPWKLTWYIWFPRQQNYSGGDLDGNSEEVVLISATNYFTDDKSNDSSGAPFPEAPIEARQHGSYSIVILRRVVAGNVQTKLVAGEVYAKPDESVAECINLAAVLDLNGDGKLEVIVQSFYYKGSQTIIYRCAPDKIEEVLSVECEA
jgi:hypothetical protein